MVMPGNEAIKNKDDAATVPVLQDGGEMQVIVMAPIQCSQLVLLIDDTVTDPFSGNALELFTGGLFC